ncbi:hypothetical protein [Micromonospora saelicesensis]|nr:hypothetical protein [Micromonospora saelicesensis]
MTLNRNAAIAVAALLAGLVGGSAAPALAKPKPAAPVESLIPHCATEDGGPQQVCVWDSAVDGNGQPAAPHNVVILYVGRPGQDPEAFRLK